MNRKQYGKRKRIRKRKIKRLIIAYLLRAIVILIPIIMMILMVCGCLYIYERFTKFPVAFMRFAIWFKLLLILASAELYSRRSE